MKIFILEVIGSWNPWYDSMHGLVIRAENEESARMEATLHAGDEGPVAWLDNTKTSCEVVTEEGSPGLILQDFNAG